MIDLLKSEGKYIIKLLPQYNINLLNKFYYEISVKQDLVKQDLVKQDLNISIGFGTMQVNLVDNILGWCKNSIGYNSFDGCVHNNYNQYYVGRYSYGDTLGVGIIKCTNDKYIILFTLNGKVIFSINRTTKDKLIPMYGFNYPDMIDVIIPEQNIEFLNWIKQ